jgi:hypothetical protein
LASTGADQILRGHLRRCGQLYARAIVWFELETDGTVLDPVESRLVVTPLEPSGLKVARIKFVDACTMVLFEQAIHGSA